MSIAVSTIVNVDWKKRKVVKRKVTKERTRKESIPCSEQETPVHRIGNVAMSKQQFDFLSSIAEKEKELLDEIRQATSLMFPGKRVLYMAKGVISDNGELLEPSHWLWESDSNIELKGEDFGEIIQQFKKMNQPRLRILSRQGQAKRNGGK